MSITRNDVITLLQLCADHRYITQQQLNQYYEEAYYNRDNEKKLTSIYLELVEFLLLKKQLPDAIADFIVREYRRFTDRELHADDDIDMIMQLHKVVKEKHERFHGRKKRSCTRKITRRGKRNMVRRSCRVSHKK